MFAFCFERGLNCRRLSLLKFRHLKKLVFERMEVKKRSKMKRIQLLFAAADRIMHGALTNRRKRNKTKSQTIFAVPRKWKQIWKCTNWRQIMRNSVRANFLNSLKSKSDWKLCWLQLTTGVPWFLANLKHQIGNNYCAVHSNSKLLCESQQLPYGCEFENESTHIKCVAVDLNGYFLIRSERGAYV